MSYSKEMHREIILDHVENPRNFEKKHDGYISVTLKNPSCGDVVTVYVDSHEGKIKDITYEVEGCSICKSSTSIMSDLVINKNIDEVVKIANEFNKMVMGSDYDENMIGEAVALQGIAMIPSRIKCATLGYKSLLKIFKIEDGD